MLLNEMLPSFDMTEVHTIEVAAPPGVVFSAMKSVRLDEMSRAVRLLLSLRSLPEKMVGREGMAAVPAAKPLLSCMLDNGFVLLGEEEEREIAFGRIVPASIGRVWKTSSTLDVPLSGAGEFLAFQNPDYIKVAANLTMEPCEIRRPRQGSSIARESITVVRTESRCLALSRHALREFLPYWRIIRPFSGLIRRLWLRGIRAHALSAVADRA